MKRHLATAALLGTLVLVLNGCGTPLIRGEVSLSDERHHLMKLEGVSVALFRETDLKRHLAGRVHEAAKISERIRIVGDSLRLLEGRTPGSELFRTLVRLKDEQIKLGNPRHAEFYLAGLPLPISGTETDAHGRFALPTREPGPFAIVARASRRFSDYSFENFTWVVSAPSGRTLHLDEAMLTSGHSALSLLHTDRDIVTVL